MKSHYSYLFVRKSIAMLSLSSIVLSSISPSAIALSTTAGSRVNVSGGSISSEAAALLSRELGQSQFANPGYDRGGGSSKGRSAGESNNESAAPAAPADAASDSDAGAKRDTQESDIFKIHKGKKLLYLLNNHRGLQVVSYKDGADKPQVIGRVKPTGNYPEDMYIDEANNRLIVLENNWADRDNYSEIQSRLLTYDVSDASKPKIVQTLELEGSLIDNKMVGDVLYIATRVNPDSYGEDAKHPPHGNVFSFNIKEKEIFQVEKLRLAKPLGWEKSMNIVEVPVGDKFKYYLTAVMTEGRYWWQWRGAKSLVQVVDITNPRGEMEDVMQVQLKGSIEEKSQTHIKNGHLIAVSNYQQAQSRDMAVAVESFALRNKDSNLMSQEDSDLKLKAKKWELKQKGLSGDALEAELQKFIDSAEGFKGVYVECESGVSPKEDEDRPQPMPEDDVAVDVATDPASVSAISPRAVKINACYKKVVADSVATARSSQENESADLRDVRVDGDLLYAFWRPMNRNTDPLEVFDISNPAQIKHQAHLEFPGWIERSVPFSYKGKKFILALGYVVDVANNERGARKPQAMIIELLERGTKFKPLVGADKSFDLKNAWSESLTGEDKMLEVKMTGEGKGEVLLQITGEVNGKYQSGGKAFSFNLDTYYNDDPANTFQEGGFMTGKNSDWLRRVFTNPEIEKVNTFSDTALGTYDAKNIMSTTGTIQAINILELARNIVNYFVLDGRGIQVVSPDYWWYNNDEESVTELRVVDPTAADAELRNVQQISNIKGAFADKYYDAKNHKLYVLTNKSGYEGEGNKQKYVITSYVYQFEVKNGKLNEAAKTSYKYDYNWSERNNAGEIDSIGVASFRQSYRDNSGFMPLQDGRILVNNGYVVREITMGESDENARIRTLKLENCVEKDQSFSIINVSGQLFVQYSVNDALISKEFQGKTQQELFYDRTYIAKLTSKDNVLSCGTKINVPGRPVAIMNGNNLLTDDTWAKDIIIREPEVREYDTYDYSKCRTGDGGWVPGCEGTPIKQKYMQMKSEFKNSQALSSLELNWEKGTATLRDMADTKSLNKEGIHQVDETTLVLIENEESRGWFSRWGNRPSTYEKSVAFVNLKDFRMVTKNFYVDSLGPNEKSSGSIVSLNKSSDGNTIALVQTGRDYQVLRLKGSSERPELLKVRVVETDGTPGEATTSFHVGGGYWWWSGSDDSVNYDSTLNSLTFAQGYNGVTQVLLP